jgi:hypothetical protein
VFEILIVAARRAGQLIGRSSIHRRRDEPAENATLVTSPATTWEVPTTLGTD